jgi:fumarate hydratase class II
MMLSSQAYKENKTLRQAAAELKIMDMAEFDRITDPKTMVSPKL